jgi:hypothetical protein
MARSSMSAGPGLGATRYQCEYKGHLITANQGTDDKWSATHVSLDASDANRPPSQKTHAFIARVMAIAHAEIEIDELEQARLSRQDAPPTA